MPTPATIAHELLTRALTGHTPTPPPLTGQALGETFTWLRDHGTALLTTTDHPHELLTTATTLLLHGTTPTWQHTAAIEILGAELTGDGHLLDHTTLTYLTTDPPGVLATMAQLVAHLYRLHDGPGATALVKATTPPTQQ